MTYEPCPKCGEYHNNCFELKDLTDEEINDVICEVFGVPKNVGLYPTHINFARAILRKAQERELLKKLAVPDEARQKIHELQIKQCGASYDTVCPPSICDCRKAQEK